jgi:hypothetical protein
MHALTMNLSSAVAFADISLWLTIGGRRCGLASFQPSFSSCYGSWVCCGYWVCYYLGLSRSSRHVYVPTTRNKGLYVSG